MIIYKRLSHGRVSSHRKQEVVAKKVTAQEGTHERLQVSHGRKFPHKGILSESRGCCTGGYPVGGYSMEEYLLGGYATGSRKSSNSRLTQVMYPNGDD